MSFVSSQKLGADPELLSCITYIKWLLVHAASRTSAEMSLKWITLTSLPASTNGLLSIVDRVGERRTQVCLSARAHTHTHTHTHTFLSQEMRTMCPEWESAMLSAFKSTMISYLMYSNIVIYESSPMMYHLSTLLHQFSAAMQMTISCSE